MTASTKLIVGGAASLLSMAMAAGGVLPGDGSLSTATASGLVQQGSGVTWASAHPSVLARAQSIAAAQIRERTAEEISVRAVVQDPVPVAMQVQDPARSMMR